MKLKLWYKNNSDHNIHPCTVNSILIDQNYNSSESVDSSQLNDTMFCPYYNIYKVKAEQAQKKEREAKDDM